VSKKEDSWNLEEGVDVPFVMGREDRRGKGNVIKSVPTLD